MRATLFILFSFFIVSCDKGTDVFPRTSNLLIGTWEYVESIEVGGSYSSKYKRTDELKDKVCLIFEEGNIFKSYDHGFCGTPPLSFFLTEGKYNQEDNILIFDIDHYFYQGRKMEIVELTADTLVVKFIE